MKINSSTKLVGDFNIALSIMARKIRQKLIKEIEELNNAVNHLGLTEPSINNSRIHIHLKST